MLARLITAELLDPDAPAAAQVEAVLGMGQAVVAFVNGEHAGALDQVPGARRFEQGLVSLEEALEQGVAGVGDLFHPLGGAVPDKADEPGKGPR